MQHPLPTGSADPQARFGIYLSETELLTLLSAADCPSDIRFTLLCVYTRPSSGLALIPTVQYVNNALHYDLPWQHSSSHTAHSAWQRVQAGSHVCQSKLLHAHPPLLVLLSPLLPCIKSDSSACHMMDLATTLSGITHLVIVVLMIQLLPPFLYKNITQDTYCIVLCACLWPTLLQLLSNRLECAMPAT